MGINWLTNTARSDLVRPSWAYRQQPWAGDQTIDKWFARVKMDRMDFGGKLDESGINLDFDFDYNVLISEVDDTLSELLNSNFYELKSKTVPENTQT